MVRAEGFEPAEYVVFIGLRRCCDLVVTALFEMDIFATAKPALKPFNDSSAVLPAFGIE